MQLNDQGRSPEKFTSPTITTFDPRRIPFQYEVIKDIRSGFDYSQGTHEILLSGALGSSKSTLMAHLAITHCLLYSGARFLLGRLAMPALRKTIWQKVVEHLGLDLEPEKDYTVNLTTASIRFRNGSEIISTSWADRQFFKVRSLDLSGAAIEELTENDEMDFYDEIKMRVGRLPNVPEAVIVNATNPGSPASIWYDYFELGRPDHLRSSLKHVYYSVTTDNPFLAPQYIEGLKRSLDPKLAQRMLYGRWIDVATEVVYYAYDHSVNFKDEAYEVDLRYPVRFAWDFNIGDGKPLSVCAFQFIEDRMHIFNEVVIEGMRTESSCDELAGKGLLDFATEFVIHGDASGRNRDTRNIKSDYDIIKRYFENYRRPDGSALSFVTDVPLANPAIRTRHNLVNAYCRNEIGETRLFVYAKAPTVDKGLRLTELKKGGNYIEDDSKAYQHVTSAVGYGLCSTTKALGRKPQATVQL